MRLATVLLVACTAAGPAGGFRVFYPETHLRPLRRIELKPSAQCQYENGHDARWTMTGARLVTGDLPPGLAIEDGAIVGAAKRPGAWKATIQFTGLTCAGKAQADETVDVDFAVAK
jgi:hypothetical protein